MARMLKYGLVLLVILSVFCGSTRCSGEESDSHWLVSPKLLSAGKLEMVWQSKLLMRENESLERLFILGDSICGLSDHNYIASLNRENGNLAFSRSFTPAGLAVLGLELYDDELVSVIGSRLVEIDAKLGTQRSVERLQFGVTCPASRNSSYFYIAGTDGRLHTLRAEDKVQIFEVAAESDSVITSIIADERFVVFSTEAGEVICITANKPRRLWQFDDAADGIVWPMVRDGDSLFFASEDTNVYRLNIAGKLVWKYQTDAVLERGPVVTEEVVYQYVHGKGLAAIDKRSGKELWQLAKGADLLAEADGKAYVITNVGTLVVMDNHELKRLYSINFAGVSRYVANVTDSKIYIAGKDGRIACLKPVE